MNTISYKDLKHWYLDNENAVANAKKYFGDKQPSIYATGFYSASSWNWGYSLGIVGVASHDYVTKKDNPIQYFEVVTQFGEVKAAKCITLPVLRKA